jgi:hypothetical protein
MPQETAVQQTTKPIVVWPESFGKEEARFYKHFDACDECGRSWRTLCSTCLALLNKIPDRP